MSTKNFIVKYKHEIEKITGKIRSYIFLQNGVYKINTFKESFILKTRRKWDKSDPFLLRIQSIMSTAFKKEAMFYIHSDNNFKHLKIPELKGVVLNKAIIIEFISNQSTYSIIDKSVVINALYEFQSISFNKIMNFKLNISSFFHNPIINIYRNLLTQLIGIFSLKELFQSVLVVTKSIFIQCNIKNVILHKDLRIDDNHYMNENNMIIYDFASVVKTKKWILFDVIDLTYDATKNQIDYDLINRYMKHLIAQDKKYSKINLSVQIRLGLIKKILGYLIKSKYKEMYYFNMKSFYINVLLDNEEFNQWICTLIKEKK